MFSYSRIKEGNLNEVIDPQEFRRALAHLFVNEKRYQLGNMDDATEVFLSLLKSIHSYRNLLHLNKEDDNLCRPLCVSHENFHISLFEQDRCSCGSTSEGIPYDFNYFTYEVYFEQILHNLNDLDINMMRILKSLNVSACIIY